jgi:hypothetical protein
LNTTNAGAGLAFIVDPILENGMYRRWISSILFSAASLWVAAPSAQTTAGSGTVVVLPTVANIAVYATEVLVRNPNATGITLNVRYYQSNDGTPPAGLRACAQLSVPASTSLSFDLGTQCGLSGAVDNFGMIILEDAASPKVHPFFAYSRTQTPTGIGFSVEGFPAGTFSGAPANVLGLRTSSAAPNYRSNCFVASLGEPVNYQIRLWQGGVSPETPIGGQITGSLGAYQTHRILDVFAAALNVAVGSAGNFANVRANFTNSSGNGAALIGFCTLETSANGSADFRIAKSDDALDNRQSRLACYGMDDCGFNVSSVTDPATITDTNKRNIHYLILDQPDFVKCDLVSDQTVSRINDLQMVLRPPGNPLGTTPFTLPAGYTGGDYTVGGAGQTGFYVFTGEKSTIGSGETLRWYIDVSFRAGGNPTTPIKYGIKCISGNGVTVPWLGTSF